MAKVRFSDGVENITRKDPRYHREAYNFLRDGLDFTIHRLQRESADGDDRHVSPQELLDGVRDLALDLYGPMVTTVFEHWGIRTTEDIGNMVFNLSSEGIFGVQDSDQLEDFLHYYTFQQAFIAPFLADGSGAPADGSAMARR